MRLIFSGEIARLAKVRPHAVSNWRARYDDFPRPLHTYGKAAVYDRDEIETWLREHGRTT